VLDDRTEAHETSVVQVTVETEISRINPQQIRTDGETSDD
jgi:hypothetical protein